MNIRRAKEIAESAEMKNVTYDGTPVYIQHVDEETESVRIYPLGQPEQEQSVPVNSLDEPQFE
jgi:small acid-soluble spore protein H (minor)